MWITKGNPELNSHIQDYYKSKIRILENKNVYQSNFVIERSLFANNHVYLYYEKELPKRRQQFVGEKVERQKIYKKEREEFLRECNYYERIMIEKEYSFKNKINKRWDETNQAILSGKMRIPCIDNIIQESEA